MGFKEVVFRFIASDDPVREVTEEHDDAELIVDPVGHLGADGTSVLVHILGGSGARDALKAALDKAGVKTEPVTEGNRYVTVQPVGDDALARLLAPFDRVEEVFDQVRLAPFIVRQGTRVARLVVADTLAEGEILRALREAAEASPWESWELIRITDHNPGMLARHLRTDELSTKQIEVAKMGLALGFYDSPRGCTLDTLADLFGISKAAVHNRLKTAERKIIARFFS